MSTIRQENLRPMARKKMKVESTLKLLIVFVLVTIFIGAGFLIFQYFDRLNAPPRTYADYQLRFWMEVLKSKPKDPGALTNIGYVYLNDDQPGKALTYFNRALKYDPKYVPALYNMGVYNRNNGKSDEAVKYLKKAAEFAEQGNKYLAYFTIGEIYQEQKKYDQAIEALNKSLEDEKQIWNSYQRLGEVYEAMGNKEKALENYREAMKFNPTSDELQKAVDRLQGGVN